MHKKNKTRAHTKTHGTPDNKQTHKTLTSKNIRTHKTQQTNTNTNKHKKQKNKTQNTHKNTNADAHEENNEHARGANTR